MCSILIVSIHMLKRLKKDKFRKSGFWLIVVQPHKKPLGRKKEIMQKCKGPKDFDICFSISFSRYDHWALGRSTSNFEGFLIFLSFLRSLQSFYTKNQVLLYL